MPLQLHNRLYNAKNPAQGITKKVLCVCSAGLLRSPTAALVLSQSPFDFNTRAAGAVGNYALIPVDEVLLHWADEVVCMEEEHRRELEMNFPELMTVKKVIVLGIPDNYEYRNKDLIQRIKDRYTERSA